MSKLIKIYSLSVVLIILLVLLTNILIPTEKRKQAERVGAKSALDEDFQATLDDFQRRYSFPGATAAYVLNDGTVGVAATGFSDAEAGILMTSHSRMLAASIGKSFVAAVLISLSCEGVLDLDAPISQWLGNRPWFSRLPGHDVITLRHLMTHSSGLPDHVYQKKFADEVSSRWREEENPFTPEDLITFILDLPQLFKPGKGWSYTDTGYILIGLVIEELTGRSFYNEIRDRFLLPNNLDLTAPADSRFLPGLASGYVSEDNVFGFPCKTTDSNGMLLWHPGIEWAGGGLVSSSEDLARWGWVLFRGNALPEGCLKELINSVPVNRETEDIRYGAGIAVYRNGPHGTVYGHGGWIPGYSSSLRYYNDYGIAIAFQINTDIGIADDSTPVLREMEARLAEIVIAAAD